MYQEKQIRVTCAQHAFEVDSGNDLYICLQPNSHVLRLLSLACTVNIFQDGRKANQKQSRTLPNWPEPRRTSEPSRLLRQIWSWSGAMSQPCMGGSS